MLLITLQFAIGKQDILGGGGSENVSSRKVKQFNAFNKTVESFIERQKTSYITILCNVIFFIDESSTYILYIMLVKFASIQ